MTKKTASAILQSRIHGTKIAGLITKEEFSLGEFLKVLNDHLKWSEIPIPTEAIEYFQAELIE